MVEALAASRKHDTRVATKCSAVRLGARIPLRILAADDTWTNREGITLICRHLGYEIDVVENGLQVLERTAVASYDLVLLDVQMPLLDGFGAARELCRREPNRHRRPLLVAVTASAQPGDRERCLSEGMDDYLSKPVMPRDLAGLIERHFEKGHASATKPSAAREARGAPVMPQLDLAHLAALGEGLAWPETVALLQQLQAAAAGDIKTLLPKIEAECRAGNRASLAASIHGLKGCALSMGWRRLAARCGEALVSLREGLEPIDHNLPIAIAGLVHEAEVAMVTLTQGGSPW
jgi:CheY-like chemotaxis protein